MAISITNKLNCCGCNACGDVCPKSAISFVTDNEGFWYPEVDNSKCIECGLCEKVCPIINIQKLKKNDFKEPECYAAENKNISVVFSSTSGGLFSALAEATYRQDGYVGGAVFNEDFSVKQVISNNREDLEKLRGSKYIQSDFSGFYRGVKNLLDKGEKVIVCGCPCQMAALRSFLKSDYDNLVILDYVCRGIGSPKVFQNYLKTFETRYGGKVVYARAKSKEYGWRNLTQQVRLDSGKDVFEVSKESVWTSNFNKDDLFLRPSCQSCKFRDFPRIADITLGDFLGVEKFNLKGLKDKNIGLSLVMLNSQKGKNYFELIKKKIVFQSVPFEGVDRNNRCLYICGAHSTVNREIFYNDLERMSLHDAVKKHYPSESKLTISKIVSYCKKTLVFLNNFRKYTRFHIVPLYQFLRYNKFSEILNGNVLFPTPHCIIERNGTLIIRGCVILGDKRVKKSKMETRLVIDKGGIFETKGDLKIGYGSDIQVFKNAHLSFGANSNINSAAIIICGEKIALGNETHIGRGVIIRDNNGEHYMDIPGYKVSRPIVTEDHIWYGEGCVIMPGVKIGQGSVISAKAVVSSNVPARCIVAGHPAQVVQSDIRWKF